MASTSIDQAFSDLKSTLEKTQIQRSEVADQLRAVVKTITINPVEDRPSAIEAKTGVINCLMSVLGEIDKASFSHTKLLLTRKEVDNVGKMSESVAQLLKAVRVDGLNLPKGLTEVPHPDETSEKLQERFDQAGSTITSGEVQE